MSSRYISDRYLPDKAIDLIDEAASRVRMNTLTAPLDIKELEDKLKALSAEKEEAVKNQEFEKAAKIRDDEKKLQEQIDEERRKWQDSQKSVRGEVTVDDIAAVVSGWTGVPVTRLTEGESERLLRMEDILHKRVIGQDEAVSAVAKAIRRGRVGLKDPKRPTGSFIFLGPTGVGKTELCRALAEAVFGDEDAMIRVDMSEYMEKHNTSKLIGSPPGYVGYDEGGQLTEKVRRKPYSVILFDEIEKAHPDVFNILLQILEDGRLTDSHGRVVNFKNTIIVMTSNLEPTTCSTASASDSIRANRTASPTREEIRSTVMSQLKKTFRPEFLNRVDEIIVFHQLDREQIKKIAGGMLGDCCRKSPWSEYRVGRGRQRARAGRQRGFDPVYGARPLRRVIQSSLKTAISEKLLEGSIKAGGTVRVYAKGEELMFEKHMIRLPVYSGQAAVKNAPAQ